MVVSLLLLCQAWLVMSLYVNLFQVLTMLQVNLKYHKVFASHFKDRSANIEMKRKK